jgi:nucleoside phosphorylase/ankyrin repeat protein
MPRQLHHDEYTVGWVCALPVELAAAQGMLDEEHLDLNRDLADNDENLYALGSIGGHNVAMVCLPAGRIGKSPAAAVATQMRATFKGIRFGLMVGIGGGVPSAEADIRLGDVVVSQPHQTFGGVVQYDAGKMTPSGFERTGSLNSPPQILLAAVAKVQANELLDRSKLSEHAFKLERNAKFQRNKAGPDVLFEATYDHESGQTCNQCSVDRQEVRQPRESKEKVVVHYGTVASGNQVMRSATERDKVSTELGGVLCFEMEAAGLMDSFPCLVIRGVCDYADSHKNKKWQPYAAATAAAYAKEVLSVIPAAEVAEVAKVHTMTKMEMAGAQEGAFAGKTSDANGISGSNQLLALPTAVNQGLFASPESLCKAIQQSDVEGVRALIASCSGSIETLLVPVSCSDNPVLIDRWKDYWGISMLERRVTALHCAIENDGERSLQILQMLLRVLPSSAIDPVGYINIIHAINSRRRMPSTRLSLAQDVDGRYLQTCTVLSWAAMLGNIHAVNLLKDAGAKINSRENWLRVTPLIAQCLLTGGTGGASVTISLLDGGALLDLQDDLGNTALHLALMVRNSAIAMALLNAGASVDLPNIEGLRALDFASIFFMGLPEYVRAAIQARRPQGTSFLDSFGYLRW